MPHCLITQNPAIQHHSSFALGSFTWPPTTFCSSRPSGPPNAGNSQFSWTGASGRRGICKSRHLTLEQVDEYIVKGKCFKCGERYTLLHKCASNFLSIIIEAEEEEEDTVVHDNGQEDPALEHTKGISAELQQLQLSRLSSNGFDGPQTCKLISQLNGRSLMTMIDSGASHCFISEQVT